MKFSIDFAKSPDNVYTRTECEAAQAVEELLALMKTTLASGEGLLISRFGKFSLRDKGKRRGRNSWTGDSMTLRGRRVVTFKCAGNLRRRFNSTGD